MFRDFRSFPVLKAVHSPVVLILDQDEGTRNAMDGLLRTAGYEPLLAANLCEAAELARTHSALQLLVLNALMDSGAPATEALCALRECVGHLLKAVLILDSLWSLPSHLRGDPHMRVIRGPVSPDALVAALEALQPPSPACRPAEPAPAAHRAVHRKRQSPLTVT